MAKITKNTHFSAFELEAFLASKNHFNVHINLANLLVIKENLAIDFNDVIEFDNTLLELAINGKDHFTFPHMKCERESIAIIATNFIRMARAHF